jgi:tRNA(Ile)-lysidine synthase
MIETAELLSRLAPVMAEAPAGPLGVAVSGGSDSLSLLLLLSRWASETGREIRAVTIDHGLRHGSAREAAAVADLCCMRGIVHETCRWEDWDGSGNLQAHAREARRRLIADWVVRHGIGPVAIGHTLDDQAETFLMRLARGSGVDGLSAMQPITRLSGVTWLRPLLAIRRNELRAWLTQYGMCWAEDPSNGDRRFDRVRVREALQTLEGLGIGPDRLAETAARMARARGALERATGELARQTIEAGDCGDVALRVAQFSDAPEEVRLRLLSEILCWVGGETYRPRFVRLAPMARAICDGSLGKGATLHGCIARKCGDRIVIRREPGRVSAPVSVEKRVWERRWKLDMLPERVEGLTIAALGRRGLSQVPNWRSTGFARETLLSTPAIWKQHDLVAAPLAGLSNGFAFRLCGLPAGFAVGSRLH